MPRVSARRETHQLVQAAQHTINATSCLPAPHLLVPSITAQRMSPPSALASTTAQSPAAEAQQRVYTQDDLSLLAEILQVAKQSAAREVQHGSGNGEVTCTQLSAGLHTRYLCTADLPAAHCKLVKATDTGFQHRIPTQPRGLHAGDAAEGADGIRGGAPARGLESGQRCPSVQLSAAAVAGKRTGLGATF